MLLKNQVLVYKPTGNLWRVLDMDALTQTVWLFNISDENALPKCVPIDDIQSNRDFTEVESPSQVTTLKLSKAAQQRRDKAYACIEPLVATLDIFEPTKRSAMVLTRAQELHWSAQTVYKHLRTWWRNGQSRLALTPQFHQSGNSAGATGGRGRRSKHGIPTYQMTSSDETLIQKILKSNFLSSETITLEHTYQVLLEQHFSYIDAEGRLILKQPGERPSIAQFRWNARKHLPAELVIRSRKGDAEFELKHRPVLGSLRHQTFTAGDIGEIDSTVADVILVHADDRSKIIGKPSLYMIRDRKSNLVIGHYVGLEESSWMAALQAILSISEDKEDLCKRYGVAYNSADWPAHRIMPKEFVADRGPEMLSNESTKIAEGLELTITNLPVRRGDWKPHVECGFKQTHIALRGVIPGYVPPENFGKRQTRDYSQDAALTLAEFRKIILETIIRFNKSPMPNYPMAPQYVLQGMQPTPINIWNVEVRDRAGLLRMYSEKEVRFALLPHTEAIVSREGIQIGDCFYSAKEALDYGWFVAAGNGRFKVEASYDLRLVDTIYIHDEKNPNSYFEAQLLDKCSHFRGRSHREVEALGCLYRQLNHQGEQVKRQLAADYHSNINSTVKNAVSETKRDAKGMSRLARKKDTRAAREDARRQDRQESAQNQTRSTSKNTTATVIPLPVARNDSASNASNTQESQKSRQQKYKDLLNGL